MDMPVSYTHLDVYKRQDQYQMLMQGLEIVARHPIEEVPDPEFSL